MNSNININNMNMKSKSFKHLNNIDKEYCDKSIDAGEYLDQNDHKFKLGDRDNININNNKSKLDMSGLEMLNEYKNEIEMFGLLMKSPELFIDTKNNNDNNKENSVNYTTRDNSKSDKGKNLKADLTAEKTIEELKKAKQDKLYSKFGESFKT